MSLKSILLNVFDSERWNFLGLGILVFVAFITCPTFIVSLTIFNHKELPHTLGTGLMQTKNRVQS